MGILHTLRVILWPLPSTIRQRLYCIRRDAASGDLIMRRTMVRARARNAHILDIFGDDEIGAAPFRLI